MGRKRRRANRSSGNSGSGDSTGSESGHTAKKVNTRGPAEVQVSDVLRQTHSVLYEAEAIPSTMNDSVFERPGGSDRLLSGSSAQPTMKDICIACIV